MIVVDASAVVALLADEGRLGQFVATMLTENETAYPSLMPYEVVNALRSMGVRGALADSVADQALRNVTTFPGIVFEFEELARRAWRLRHNLTIYDAVYVALAQMIDRPLLTLDRRLVAAAGTQCRFVDVPAA